MTFALCPSSEPAPELDRRDSPSRARPSRVGRDEGTATFLRWWAAHVPSNPDRRYVFGAGAWPANPWTGNQAREQVHSRRPL